MGFEARRGGTKVNEGLVLLRKSIYYAAFGRVGGEAVVGVRGEGDFRGGGGGEGTLGRGGKGGAMGAVEDHVEKL